MLRSATCHHLAAVRALFWISAALIVWTQALYAPALRAAAAPEGLAAHRAGAATSTPSVTLIVAAYNEEAVIAAKVANALALDWPRERLEVIVAVDGGERRDRGAARARGRRRPRARAAARRQDPRAGRRRAGRARRA